MANLYIFSVKDIKTSTFDIPFTEGNVINATRGFALATNNPQTKVGSFPHDFELHELGYMDDVTGKLHSYETPKFIINAVSAIKLNKKIDAMDVVSERTNIMLKKQNDAK